MGIVVRTIYKIWSVEHFWFRFRRASFGLVQNIVFQIFGDEAARIRKNGPTESCAELNSLSISKKISALPPKLTELGNLET